MDDTQQSRASDVAATRKRRSSILKSQRAPRTPFSELEFNVATPTDTSKSRRVSFSRRTGVAEFITNEATTTWKNFYEEHNKSMESSGNESEANAPRQPVGHIGNRLFEQQFQEVEAVDFIGTFNTGNHSFTHQLASIETTDGKLTAPQNNFELSALTDQQSKLFGNDFTAPTMGEMSGRIDVNFSTLHKIGDDKDDLDEIQRDIDRVSTNVVCQGPARDRQNVSEYIEVDLNMTHVAMHNHESDMSITDTVLSPKVQDVSKSCSIDKKVSIINDWVADKENIVVNPYVAPRESVNFALNEEPDKVLVFDGKRLTIQSEKSENNYILPPNLSETPQRKTIVLNVNDDLPNFVDNPQISKVDISGIVGIADSNPSSASSDVTVQKFEVPSKRLTIIDNGNISITQVVPSNIITESDKRKSVLYGDGDLSVTQALPAQILTHRRRTVTYDADTGNISITQGVPSNIIVNNVDRRQTVVFDDDLGNVSITQAIPTNILAETRRRTVVYDDKDSNISITQAVPATILPAPAKRQTIIFEDANISVTQVLPTKVIPKPGRKRQTIHYEDDDGNVSVTQMVPTNLILPEHIDKTVNEDVNKAQALPVNVLGDEVLTNVYETDAVDISITQAVPTSIIQATSNTENIPFRKEIDQMNEQKADIDAANILPKQSLPNDEVIQKDNEKRKTIVFGEDDGNISMTQALPLNVLLDKLDSASENSSYRNLDGSQFGSLPKIIPMSDAHAIESSGKKTFIFEEEDVDMSVTEAIDIHFEQDKFKPVTFGDTGSLSMSKPIPADVVNLQNDKSEVKQSNISVQDTNQDIFVYQTVTTHSALKLQQKIINQDDLKSENPELASRSEDKPSSATEDIESKQSVESVREVSNTDRQSFIKDVVLMDDVKSETPKASVTSMDVEDADDLDKIDTDLEKDKKSVLDELLDMSAASADGIEDKGLMVKVESKPSVVNVENAPDRSSESLFYVTKDSDEEAQTEPKAAIVKEETPAIEFKEENDIIPELKKRLSELKEVASFNADKKNSPRNRHYEKVLSSDLHITESGEDVEQPKVNKSFKNANDTRELLDMLSHLTDKTVNMDEGESAPVVAQAIGNKSEVIEPKRLSFAPNRRSIVLSRENLLSNMSMAQAALQKSRFELDDSDATEDTRDSPTENSLHKKSVRMSNEVVKTLHFEDESISESSIKSDAKVTPLKKTAFGETSYMRESKAKVIPSFLKDVSDGMKELMLDLVKPMTDVMPFDAAGQDKAVKKSASTCSTQIQANLVTSSQIDIESELYSNAESCYNMSTKSPIKTVSNASEKSFEVEMETAFTKSRVESRSPIPQFVPGSVLVFDHNNPLNNIHLGPSDYACAHKYNPNKADGRMSEEVSSDKLVEYEIERVSMQYNVGRLSHAMEGDACSDNAVPITQSNISKTMSIDQSVDVKVMEMRDTEVNTLIAMKGNKELLQASSSLTLVDDAVTNSKFEADIDTKTSSVDSEKPDKRVSISPVHIIYQIEEQYPEKLVEDVPNVKSKKRNYSPTSRDKYKHITSVDITPKPNTKMARLSNSPNIFKKVLDLNHASEHALSLLAAGHDITAMDLDKEERKPKKSPKKPKLRKPNTSLTVQQVITEVYKDDGNEKNVDEPLKSDCSSADPKSQSDIGRCNSLEVISSDPSGHKINAMKDVYSGTTTESGVSPLRGASRIDWHPELINELSSKNLVTECESGVNVVAKIDMLPFMGSHECEWESSSVDSWSFRLLHARLRLSVRLEHRHDNAARTRVRADTAVHGLSVEIARQDKKNPVATLCVRFACEALRYMCGAAGGGGGGARAGDVPALLRRAAAVARVALRWGRAMQDARAQLAYTLDNDGCLALKVANIPLRSVWEVRLRVELVVEDARETPWPRAGGVHVSRVVSDVPLRDADVQRALQHVPRDWGHAPRTIWKIFKYLKHKTRDDEMLLGM